MKTFSVIFFLSVLPLLSFSQNINSIQTEFQKLYWLNGAWNQTNIKKPGRTTIEQWHKSGDYEMKCQATTIQNSDTVFVERVTLIIKDDAIYYVADVPQNKAPVPFKLTSISNNGFVCENPTHDFPKKISYLLTGTELKAVISGNNKSIEFIYQKRE